MTGKRRPRGFATAVRCLAAAAAVGLAALCAPASAQSVAALSSADLKREHDVLFAQILKNPSNVDVSFRYAEVATRLGDYEAAIGALERIIFYNPNLPRVRLELGVLYFRLGSYEMSRSYFESAIAPADTPLEVRNRVAGFLAEIERRVQTTQFSLFSQFGMRFQTNANAGPNTPFVRALGFDAVLSGQNTRKRDWNWFGSTTARYVYDFENQRGDVFEAMVTGYYSRQFDIQRLNTGLVEVNLGPRLAISPDYLQGWSVKPYVVGAAISLADNNYLNTGGYGVTFAIPLIVVLLEPGYEIRRRAFKNSTDITTAKEQRGWIHTSYLNASGPIVPDLRYQVRFAHNRVNAFRDYNAYTSNAVDVSFPFEFTGLIESARKWTIAPFGGFTKTLYDIPNPIVDPSFRRKDKEFRFGTQLDMPIWKHAGFGMVVQYQNTMSSIRNYNTRNFSVTLGPTVRF